ncbi:MAG: hypothetical protein NTW10_02605 [Bacteroidetes bacterium]|nr:hypothetical protein [Bacteroidota bacterium]
MSKKKRSSPYRNAKNFSKQPVKKGISKQTGPDYILFDRMNGFLEKHMTRVFFFILSLTLLFCLLLFDIRFSTAGDDSAYVIRAYDFIHHFTFPAFQGPLYPVLLSPLVALFGIQALPLKFLSVLFILGAFWLTYKTFKGRIPPILLTSVLVLFSVNSYLLYYASQTFSEACFVFLQSAVFFLFFLLFLNNEQAGSGRTTLFRHLALASLVLLLGLTRTIGYSSIIAIVVYFLLTRQWKNSFFFLASFILVLALFLGLKSLVWGSSDIHFASQLQGLMSKNYYNPGSGSEDIPGFVHRFITNSNLYISDYFYTILGLRGTDHEISVSPLLTVITYLMLLLSIILALRKNRYLLFTGLYAILIIAITFLIAHTSWGQNRFIIPYFPLILLMLLFLLYQVLEYKKMKPAQFVFPVLVVILFVLSLGTAISQVKSVRQVTSKYSCLTPDWENYCKISEWASENLPPDAVVACRKPTVSFIYGNGKRFFGITQFSSSTGASLLSEWQKNKAHEYFLPAESMEKSLPSGLYKVLKSSIVACGIRGELFAENIRFYIMNFPDSGREETFNTMKSFAVFPGNNIDSLRSMLGDRESILSVIYPDTLLKNLMDGGVTHVIRANLRLSARQKTDQIINTVERYMDFIKVKYPKIAVKIVQIGENDNEPAVLYRLNYELYGLKFPEGLKSGTPSQNQVK